MIRFLLHAYGEFGPGHPLRRTAWPYFDLLFVHEGRLVVRPEAGEPVELAAGEGILRMNEAKRLLGETLMPIKEIATRCGYGSAIAFHRVFRESSGTTPRKFRVGNRVA